jgi:hypothetical protein
MYQHHTRSFYKITKYIITDIRRKINRYGYIFKSYLYKPYLYKPYLYKPYLYKPYLYKTFILNKYVYHKSANTKTLNCTEDFSLNSCYLQAGTVF